MPSATMRSASARSTTRVVASSGRPGGSAARSFSTGVAIALRLVGGGGTIQMQPEYVAESPSAASTKSTRPSVVSARAISAQASASRPENDASSADSRTPTAMSGPAPSRIASSTSRQKRTRASRAPL